MTNHEFAFYSDVLHPPEFKGLMARIKALRVYWSPEGKRGWKSEFGLDRMEIRSGPIALDAADAGMSVLESSSSSFSES